MQVEFGEVEHFLSQHLLLLLDLADAVETKPHAVVPDALRLNVAEAERLAEAPPPGHRSLGTLLFGRKKDQVKLPGDAW